MKTKDNTQCNYKLKISAVGDIMLGVAYIQSINEKNNILNRLKRDYKSILEGVRKHLKDTDILFGNFESIIHKDFNGNISKDPKLLATTEKSIDLLKYGGFDVLNLGNNHIFDHGVENAENTEKILRKNDFNIIGSPTNAEEKLLVVKKNDLKIGFLGYNLCDQENKTEVSKVLDDVKNSRDEVDLLVVSLHWGWGKEHMSIPSKEEIKLGRGIIDNGADIVLGHHSHVFQPVEIYKGKVIAYSLGNFIFDQWRIENKVGGILEIYINENFEMRVKLIPTIIDDYKVKVYEDTNKQSSLIVDEIEPILSDEEYKKELRKKKKKHNREFLDYYIRNVHKLSFRVNKQILKELAGKVFRKFS